MLSINRSDNQFLSALRRDDFELLQPHLRGTLLRAQSVLFEADDTVAKAYFPLKGAVSLVVALAGGQSIEAAMIGRNGMLGGFAAFAPGPALSTAIVQVEGTAATVDIEIFRQLTASRESVRDLLIRHQRALFAQTQQIAACNALHPLEARFSRWLLWARDAAGGTPVAATQESIAELLGVRRTSICLIAHTMQQAGLIRTRRGHIDILNDHGLRNSACECHARIAARYAQAFAPESVEPKAAELGYA
jgi:CRP-like cAMP-binding protein